jgi:acyl-CoA synthetase (NDP forming)
VLIVDPPPGIDRAAARAIAATALEAGREWLTPDEVYRLLTAYGLPGCPQALVDDVDTAVRAAAQLGYPLAVKLGGAGLHKSDVGGVRLGIADESQLRAAVADLATLSDGPILLQPMVRPGTELIVGSVHDPQCGPLVMLGAGGVLTDILGDRSFGLAPMAADQADELIDGLRSARLLDGYRGAPVVSRAAVRDILVRVGALVDDVPQIAELDLNPLVCRVDGITVVDARVRVAPAPVHPDPLVRQLRGPH